jgi:hypothetical protein
MLGLHLTELEEGGMGAVLRQHLQDLRRPDRIRAVVEAEEEHLLVTRDCGCGRVARGLA